MRFETNVTINRPAQEVFDFITDPSKLATWHSVILDAQHTSGGQMREGSTLDLTAQFLGRQVQPTAHITELDPPRSMVASSKGQPFPMEMRFTLTPQNGSTQVTMEMDAEPGRHFSLAEAALEPVAKHRAHADLQALKALLESS